MAVAALQTNLHWSVCELSNVSELSNLFLQLKSLQLNPGCILAGFDFPIGLPLSYASAAGITDFLDSISLFGKDEWEKFYIPSTLPSDISIYRPFYPNRSGGSKHSHLESGLNLPFDKLYRLCEIRHDNRRPACPLFWTLGSQQVGKAAISGWHDLLTPALIDHQSILKIWPFSGSLAHIYHPDNIVVVETYPAGFYSVLGVSFSSPIRRSKRRRLDRMAFAETLITWAKTHHVELADQIMSSIMDGFGNALDGEDRFDALVGLYGMINVILGVHPVWEPNIPKITKIEGWIFGQSQPKGVIIDN
jgi:hypothetical protein